MQRIVILLAILPACPSVLAATLVGPPAAMLGGERFGLSAEYSQTDADIAFHHAGTVVPDSFDFDTGYALFSAAATRWWEFFIRLGAARADASDFGGDTNVSWGMGSRLTAFEWGDFTWGAMLQFTNIISRVDTMEEFVTEGGPVLLETEEELDVVEYDFATGPTWRHGRLSLYGGLLLRYVTGYVDLDAGFTGNRFDIDRQWDIGGYVGGTLSLFKADPSRAPWFSRCDLVAEGRFTDDSTGFSVALLLPFGGEP